MPPAIVLSVAVAGIVLVGLIAAVATAPLCRPKRHSSKDNIDITIV